VRINPQLKILGLSAYNAEGMARCYACLRNFARAQPRL
jgi:hypothetical protein